MRVRDLRSFQPGPVWPAFRQSLNRPRIDAPQLWSGAFLPSPAPDVKLPDQTRSRTVSVQSALLRAEHLSPRSRPATCTEIRYCLSRTVSASRRNTASAQNPATWILGPQRPDQPGWLFDWPKFGPPPRESRTPSPAGKHHL